VSPTRAPAVLACGEVRGGNEPVFTEVLLPGLEGTLYSSPCHGPQGGDVHYLSVCGSGLLARVCLADVAGHGETIAAIGREMHQQLRNSVDIVDERRVLAALDARLATGEHRAITTAALLTYYPPARRLTVSYAGHPPAWLHRQGAWAPLAVDQPKAARGPMDLPLGTGLGPSYSRGRHRLTPGDRVLVVTDGVLEAPSPGGVEFGAAGVEAVLTSCAGSCAALAANLLDALRAHTGCDPLVHDDVTFFVGEFVDGPPGPAIWHVVKNRLLSRVSGRS
jgi:serine phosphatase RsbU (regulator of sigma subunit)